MAEELKAGDIIWEYSKIHFPRVQQGTISYVGKNYYGKVTSCIAKFLTSSGWEERSIFFFKLHSPKQRRDEKSHVGLHRLAN